MRSFNLLTEDRIIPLSNKALLAASVLAMGLAGSANATLWDAGGGVDTSYDNPLNWAGDTIPLATFVEIKSGTDVVTIDSATTGGRLFLENNPTINVVTGADVTFSGGSMSITSATFQHSGGTVNINQSGALPFGVNGSGGDTSTYNISGGTLNVNGAGQTTSITNVFGTAINTGQASGNLDVSIILGTTAGGTGNMTVSGNAEVKSRVGIALSGTSSFTVDGSDADINFGELASFGGSWYQATGAELSFVLDAGGVSTIGIDQGTNDTIATKHVAFEDGAILDLSGTLAAGSYTLMSFENGDIKNDQGGLGGTGLVFSGSTDLNWSISVDNSGDNGLLIATYVPEPGSLALLGMGGLLVARRRRD